MIISKDRHPAAACFTELDDALTALTTTTKTTIALNAHAAPHEIPPGAIVYNLENVGLQVPTTAFPEHELWDFSKRNVAAWQGAGRSATHVPVGYHPSMTRFAMRPSVERDIDIVFCGAMNPRRERVLGALEARGLRVARPTVYGPTRDAILARSRLALNMLFYPDGTFPVLRAAHCAANHLPVLSEHAPEAPSWAVLQCSYDDLVDRCIELLNRCRELLDHHAEAAFLAFRMRPLVLPAGAPSTLAPGPPKRQTIALCMIVKNESHIIERCLASVRSLITSFTIVDTGSTDGTQDIIRRALADVPGEVHDRPWRGFGESRTEAIDLTRGTADYALIIDADDELRIDPNAHLPPLHDDTYELTVELDTLRFRRSHLIRLARPWQYVGVVHEYLHSDEATTAGFLPEVTYVCNRDGARSRDPEKYRQDAELLEHALETEPENARYVFYAAQSWRDAQDDARARQLFLHCITMPGLSTAEIFIAALEAAKANERLGSVRADVIAGYLDACRIDPARAEPLYELARYCRNQADYSLAWIFATSGVQIARPPHAFFARDDIYAWRMKNEYALAAYRTGRFELALAVNVQLLASDDLPADQQDYIRANCGWCHQAIAKRHETSMLST